MPKVGGGGAEGTSAPTLRGTFAATSLPPCLDNSIDPFVKIHRPES